MNSKKKTYRHTGCCWNEFTNSDLWNPRIRSNTTKTSGKPRGDEQARETRKKHTPEEEVGRYRSSVTPVSQPKFLALVRGSRTQSLHPLRRTRHIVLDHQNVNPSRSSCVILLMLAKRGCGAAAFSVVVISFSL